MRYLLAVLSHGDHSTRKEALAAFREHVKPDPNGVALMHDEGAGFCVATGRLWRQAVRMAEAEDCDYVFWLEHDFLVRRDVDVEAMAALLRWVDVAQVSLMRQPCNEQERRAGGVVQRDPSAFSYRPAGWAPGDCAVPEHLSHRVYFTTNPSLMRTSFMRQNPWPDYPSECEGRFTIDLVAAGYSFTILGRGEPWIEHIGGQRTGKGY